MVGGNDQDNLLEVLEVLEELPHKQTIIDLQVKGEKLQMEVNRLKEELEDKKKANAVAATKLSNRLDLIRKMEGYVQQPVEVLNKARFFDEGLAKNSVTTTKVIPILVDFNKKMEEILFNMRGPLEGLEVQGLVPLDQMPNISINTKELPMLQRWEIRTMGQTPTPMQPTQPQASELAREAPKEQEELAHELESQPGQDPTLEESESS